MWWKNLIIFFEDKRRRNVILVSTLLLIILISMGVIRFFHQVSDKHFRAKAQVESVRPIRSIPGGVEKAPSQEYASLQKQNNNQQAKEAKKTGKSAIATIVDRSTFEAEPHHHDTNSSFKPLSQNPSDPMHAFSFLRPPKSEAQELLDRQNDLLVKQKAQVSKQQIQSGMNVQMNELMTQWNQVPLQHAVTGSNHFSKENKSYDKIARIKAGTILNAVLLTTVNSDQPGPILAKIVSNELENARLIGSLTTAQERVLIQFDRINLLDAKQTIPIQAVAVDAKTARSGLSSYTDKHLILRYGSLFGAALLQLYSSNYQQASIMSTAQNRPYSFQTMINPTDKLIGAVGHVGSHASDALAKQFHRPYTIHVNSGTGIGVLFTEDLMSDQLKNL